MKLIVGLGNPGKEYENTRHNVGFQVLDLFAEKNQLSFSKKKENAIYAEGIIHGEKIILLKPQTYMNLSGEAVKTFQKFYKIKIEDILIIADDLDLPLGSYRLKQKGSCGGHNGLRNIEDQLQTQNYKRLKIGIAKQKEQDTISYVLGKFSKEEKKVLDQTYQEIMTLLDDYLLYSFLDLMSKYNHKG